MQYLTTLQKLNGAEFVDLVRIFNPPKQWKYVGGLSNYHIVAAADRTAKMYDHAVYIDCNNNSKTLWERFVYSMNSYTYNPSQDELHAIITYLKNKEL